MALQRGAGSLLSAHEEVARDAVCSVQLLQVSGHHIPESQGSRFRCREAGGPTGFLKSASISKPQSTGKGGAVIDLEDSHLSAKVLPFASLKEMLAFLFSEEKNVEALKSDLARENLLL